MSPLLSVHLESGTRFPRVSGDEPLLAAIPAPAPAFSPREWG